MKCRTTGNEGLYMMYTYHDILDILSKVSEHSQ